MGIKDAPNNLIFHLKRFDYDLVNNARIKINDTFQFPAIIDMAPYFVDHLSDETVVSQPDIFELTGVLVHSGTAESGHYYSYVRERKRDPVEHDHWIEFNDVEVLPFDFENIGERCYGGLSDQTNQSLQLFKPYNAYMLFYRRLNSEISEPPDLRMESHPTQVQIPSLLNNRYALMNQSAIRHFCLFDEAYLEFSSTVIDRLLSSCRTINVVSEDIVFEVATSCQGHLERICSRFKDSKGFIRFATVLQKLLDSSPQCRRITLSWICNQESDVLRNLLLRCPRTETRRSFSLLVANVVRSHDRTALSAAESDGDSALGVGGLLEHFFARMKELVNVLHIHWKAWDDYFGLLGNLADLGIIESRILLQMGFLQLCLELMVLDHSSAHSVRERELVYQRIANFIDKKRKYSFIGIVELCWKLFRKVDLNARQVGEQPQHRYFNDKGNTTLTKQEYELIVSDFSPTIPAETCVFLEKAIHSHANKKTVQNILRMLLFAEDHLRLTDVIKVTLMEGLLTDPASLAVPFLDATLAFCEVSPNKQSVSHVLHKAAAGVESIGACAGAENLQFFKDARRLHNIIVKSGGAWFEDKVRSLANLWAPPLLTFHDVSVRAETFEFLNILMFSHDLEEMDNEQHAYQWQKAGRALCTKCLERLDQIISSNTVPDLAVLELIKQVVVLCLERFCANGWEGDDRLFQEADSKSLRFPPERLQDTNLIRAKGIFISMGQFAVQDSEGVMSGKVLLASIRYHETDIDRRVARQ